MSVDILSTIETIVIWQIHNKSNVVRGFDDDDEFCWQSDRLAVAKFSKSEVWYKVPEGSTVILGDAQISLQRCIW